VTPERWQSIKNIVGAALELPPERRPDYLAQACHGDATLLREVDSLLACNDQLGGFIEVPVVQSFEAAAGNENALTPGTLVGRYEVVGLIGSGGMGEVYRASDPGIGRDVAIKVLPKRFSTDLERLRRFEQEVRAAGTLNHPNILVIHDVGNHAGAPFIVSELLQGETLRATLSRKALPLSTALRHALEIARGLAASHAKGIVHRDLKPENIFVTTDGRVKILDFGIAKLTHAGSVDGEAATTSDPQVTQPGAILGTLGYMSPEQVRREPTGSPSDIFSLAAILYEMLTGHRAFAGPDSVDALLNEDPPELGPRSGTFPDGLEQLLRRCLKKDPHERIQSADVLASELEALLEGERERGGPRRKRYVLVAIAAVVAACGAAVVFAGREARGRWIREQALPDVARLVERGHYSAAFELAEKVEQLAPGDPTLVRLWPQLSRSFDIETVPAGADVYAKEYGAEKSAWRSLGRSPLSNVRLPLALYQWRFAKPGFVSAEWFPEPNYVTGAQPPKLRVVLDRAGTVPQDMVHVPGGSASIRIPGLDHLPPVQIGDYLIDRTEVTNREFKAFVDAGGYAKRDLWQHEFIDEERRLSWVDATALFRDRTGQPGPATWERGNYPEGEDDLPVTGVSWFEAAAYAAFVGKALPTVYQWSFASGAWAAWKIVPLSNLEGPSIAKIATYRGMGPFGTFDMAGNAKEWCWNATGKKRFILGGAWNEPSYLFFDPDARSPFARDGNFGFRLVRNLDDRTAPAALDPVTCSRRDYRKEKPASADVFRAFTRLYAYDKGPLKSTVESVDETSELWRKEKIRYAAAYGGEQVVAYLFTPRDMPPPYQTVVFFPGASAIRQRSSDTLAFMPHIVWVVRSGRAFLYPVYKSTYERGDGLTSPGIRPATAFYRDHVVQWSKDLGRSIDYIETRNDLDHDRIAFYGLSLGTIVGPILMAVEDRIAVGVLASGGLRPTQIMPEADPINFAPYLRKPILMVNGRHDFLFPYETSQVPLFELLGAGAKDKRHVVVDSGHAPPNDLLAKEMLEWLDRYLGVPRPADVRLRDPTRGQ
jgi:formylglycine-generating enzyme required for sulfatase activity